jgi:hypothetical protein
LGLSGCCHTSTIEGATRMRTVCMVPCEQILI